MARTRGSAESAVDIDGWIRTALEPLEPIEDDERGGNTEVGSTSVARALIAIRDRIKADEDAQNAIPTAPPPPQSDIRRIGSTLADRDEDPLALYVEALGPRARRETVKLTMRPRQMTLVMNDRPRAHANVLTRSTPPMTMVPVARRAPIADPLPPRVFRGAVPIVLLAFGLGIFVSGVVVFVLARI
jgi:hypothetical protein